jgi:hypothetical protein
MPLICSCLIRSLRLRYAAPLIALADDGCVWLHACVRLFPVLSLSCPACSILQAPAAVPVGFQSDTFTKLFGILMSRSMAFLYGSTVLLL